MAVAWSGREGEGLCGGPPSICPCRLQVALPPPRANRPCWPPRDGAWGPLKGQTSPRTGTLGPSCDEELGAGLGTSVEWGVGREVENRCFVGMGGKGAPRVCPQCTRALCPAWAKVPTGHTLPASVSSS